MASYPTAVKVFTTKNTGDTIQAADVDDLQDEVNAIEAGILNGTAPLNSSNSTVVNLSVLGGLNVVGGSTVVNLTVTGTLTAPTVSAVPFVRLTNSAKQDVANGAWVGLNFDTEVIDASGLHSTSVNSSRINLTSTGSWIVGASVFFNINSSGTRRMRILVNDTNAAGYTAAPLLADGAALALTVQIYATSTTDYATVVVFEDSGSTGSVIAHTGAAPCTFWAQRTSI